MDKRLVIFNALIVNEGQKFRGWIIVNNGIIENVGKGDFPDFFDGGAFDAGGKLCIPGVIDCHVHFREPGVTHKADLASESRAAVAGGVTSFMEMPNTVPQTTTLELLEEKFQLASEKSLANYSFFLGATNDNIGEIEAADHRMVCGVKVFFGASTGNMLVDNLDTLEEIFKQSPLPVAAHCEDETTIRHNSALMEEKYGDDVPVAMHPVIRSAEACYMSSELAVKLAKKHNTRLHITHLSTANELDLLTNTIPLQQKRITAEACVHYLWFCDEDYDRLGTRIKVNPAIKTAVDREALLQGLLNDTIDIISTDHAPHLIEEKNQTYFKAPSGTPLVQHALPAMLELWHKDKISIEKIVEKMCHTPSDCYSIEKRGYIRPGYFADLVIVDPEEQWIVSPENIHYKCGWSAFEGTTFHSQVTHTFVNGKLVYSHGQFFDTVKGKRLTFDRK
jgi:dihydroorotase